MNSSDYRPSYFEPPPDSATWPRLMTGPHPKRAGSYGSAMVEWAESRNMQPKRSAGSRWWQRLVAERALEHDEAGNLVWSTVIISGPRQIGKSWLERMVCAWRIHQCERWGEEQALLHVAHKLVAAQEVWRPAARWATGEGFKVRWANGEQMIELPDGSRWMIQAATDGAGVSFSLSMALVDEAWRVARQVVDDALEPTMAESVSPQLWLVSTAGTSESDLMMSNRSAAMAALGARDPGRTLLIEWSAAPDAELDIDDVTEWRAMSPHWDERRYEAMARARERSDERAFRQQWLNQWVPSTARALIDPDRWGALVTESAPPDPITFGVDVDPSRSWAAVVAYGGGIAEVAAVSPVAGSTAPALGEGVAWVAPWLAARAESHGGEWVVGIDATGPAAPIAEDLAGLLGPRVVKINGRDMATASGQVFDRMTASPLGVRFRSHPLFESAVLGARWRTYGQTKTFARDEIGGVSGVPLVATTAAIWAADHGAQYDEPGVF